MGDEDSMLGWSVDACTEWWNLIKGVDKFQGHVI